MHADDMAELIEKVRDADIIVYATPLYVYTVSGLMKDFMDRVLPMVQPYIDVKDGLCIHPPRYESKSKTIVLISNSGFPEQGHFSGLKETMRCWFRGKERTIGGMICCAGGVMLGTPAIRDGMTWYLDAVRQAGREIIEQRHINEATQATLDTPLMDDPGLYSKMANSYWSSLGIERIGTAKESPVGQPDVTVPEAIPLSAPTGMETMRDLVSGMALAFNAEAAGDMQAVIQFSVPDEAPGQYFLHIAHGTCKAFEGMHPAATATITTPAHVWLDITRGKLNGATAFLSGQYTVSGDLNVLTGFEKLFPAHK